MTTANASGALHPSSYKQILLNGNYRMVFFNSSVVPTLVICLPFPQTAVMTKATQHHRSAKVS